MRLQLPGRLAEWQSEPYDDWPLHCKMAFGRLRQGGQFTSGAAAYAVQAKVSGVKAGGSGAFNADLAREHNMAERCCRSSSVLARVAAGLLASTDPDEESEGAAWAALRAGREDDAEEADALFEDLSVVAETSGEQVTLSALCNAAWAQPPEEPPETAQEGVYSCDFCMENPANALWLWLLSLHPRFARWHLDTTSYCKQHRGATRHRKTTCFLSSTGPSRPLPAPCCPSDPCETVRENGKHDIALCAKEKERNLVGYLERSRVPTTICARHRHCV